MQNGFKDVVIIGVYLTNLTIWGLHIILALFNGDYTMVIAFLAVIAILSALVFPLIGEISGN